MDEYWEDDGEAPQWRKELGKAQADRIGKKLSDLLSIWNAMYLGIVVESFYEVDIQGAAGGVSHMIIDDAGKHLVKKINDMSYML